MIHFNADPEAMYTLTVEDLGIEGKSWFHLLKYNIKGDDLTTGEYGFDWIPSFQ